MASRGIQAPSVGERRSLSSVQVRENYHRRLDKHIKEAVDSYRSIIDSCTIKDTVGVMRGDFESQVDTSNLSKAAEGILRLISELKVACIVQEVTDTKQEYHDLRSVFDTEVKATERTIASLSESILPVLETLENHYYQSCTKWSSSMTRVSNVNMDSDDKSNNNKHRATDGNNDCADNDSVMVNRGNAAVGGGGGGGGGGTIGNVGANLNNNAMTDV